MINYFQMSTSRKTHQLHHHHVQYQKKTNDLILKKFRDVMDGRTDRQTRVISLDAVRLTSSVQKGTRKRATFVQKEHQR